MLIKILIILFSAVLPIIIDFVLRRQNKEAQEKENLWIQKMQQNQYVATATQGMAGAMIPYLLGLAIICHVIACICLFIEPAISIFYFFTILAWFEHAVLWQILSWKSVDEGDSLYLRKGILPGHHYRYEDIAEYYTSDEHKEVFVLKSGKKVVMCDDDDTIFATWPLRDHKILCRKDPDVYDVRYSPSRVKALYIIAGILLIGNIIMGFVTGDVMVWFLMGICFGAMFFIWGAVYQYNSIRVDTVQKIIRVKRVGRRTKEFPYSEMKYISVKWEENSHLTTSDNVSVPTLFSGFDRVTIYDKDKKKLFSYENPVVQSVYTNDDRIWALLKDLKLQKL